MQVYINLDISGVKELQQTTRLTLYTSNKREQRQAIERALVELLNNYFGPKSNVTVENS